FAELKQPYEYNSLEYAKAEVTRIGSELSHDESLSPEEPLIIGISGYGNVSQGAQEIIDLLPCENLSPADLRLGYVGSAPILKVVYLEQDMFTPLSGSFDLQDYYSNPGKYRAILEPDLQRLSILVNCIYWTESYPRLVTRRYLQGNSDSLKLQVIGDISIDIEGAVEISHKATMPDLPSYTYLPRDDRFEDGVKPDGVSVMAIDNLPCELSREATEEFSAVLREFLPGAADVDMSAGHAELDLAAPLKRALILKRGEFPPDYLYMKGFLQEEQL
ncbi:MAG: hypothetical protein HN368_22765, partial [Spirochaetales bacterium]|nr:hypothetical protein [Spirochaetales bacterium]